jgi:hypothetical protein
MLSGEFNALKNLTNWIFPKWMEQQGKRQPFYAFFRKIPYIQRLQRDLFSTFAAIQDKAINGDIHDSDFLDELNNLDKLIEAHFKANDDIENEFPDDQLSFESIRPKIPNSTSINHDINKRSPAPIFLFPSYCSSNLRINCRSRNCNPGQHWKLYL